MRQRSSQGHYADVEPFLEAYERLCWRFNVTLERDQCDTVRQYCSREVVGVIEGLTSFRDGKWPGLTGELIHLYDADRNNRRYAMKDLKSFVKKQAKKKINSTGNFKEYQRAFMAIGGWLSVKDKLSSARQAKYFMKGIHHTLQRKLKNRLGIINPHKPVRDPWAILEVVKAAEYLLEPSKADYSSGDSSDDTDDSSTPTMTPNQTDQSQVED